MTDVMIILFRIFLFKYFELKDYLKVNLQFMISVVQSSEQSFSVSISISHVLALSGSVAPGAVMLTISFNTHGHSLMSLM